MRMKRQKRNWMKHVVMRVLSAAVFTGCIALNPAMATPTPVLDSLSGVNIPGTTETYPSSLYTLTEITPADTNNLDSNVIRYYNPSVDNNVHYYSVTFKNNGVIGTGSLSKYYKWAKDSNGIKLVEGTANDNVLTIKYNSDSEIETILVEEGMTMSESINNIYVGQSIKRAIDSKGTIVNVASRFVGNNIQVNPGDPFNYSAVMAETDANINNVNSSFIGNTVNIDSTSGYGTMVKALGNIDNVKSEFIGNTVTTNAYLTGAILQAPSSGTIGTIQSDFLNNSAFSTATNIDGIAIGNEGNIGIIQDSLFTGNYGVAESGNVSGGAIYNSGNITNGILNTVFTDNYVKSESGDARGGAIFNSLNASAINTSFMGNYAQSATGKALGGAIYTDTDFSIIANDGKTVEFKDNYVKVGNNISNQAIYVNGSTATLTLKADDEASIILNDAITGRTGYRTLITGDGTGYVYLNNIIDKSNVTAENINLILADGNSGDTFDFYSLNADNTAKWAIDIDFITGESDRITVGDTSGGVVYIYNLNNIGSSERPTVGKVIQVLSSAPDTIQLALNQDIVDYYHREYTSPEFQVLDEVDRESKWNDIYYTQTLKSEIEEGVRLAITDTTRENPDSIEYYINRTDVDLGKTKTGDTLRLLNEMSGERSFTANSAEQTYTLTEDLGSTNTGTISLNGLVDTEAESISQFNAGSHTMFELDKANTTVNIKDVQIASDVTTDGGILNITHSSAQANITSTSTDYPTKIETAEDVNGIYNDGKLIFNGAGEKDILTGITGGGSLTVTGGKTLVDNNASIEQGAITTNLGGNLYLGDNSTLKADSIQVSTNSSLSVVATNLLSNASITGSGAILELRGGTLSHVISQTAGNGVRLVGDVTIEHGEGENIKGQVPNVIFTDNSSLIANADDINGNISGVTGLDKSTASMTLTGGTLTKNVAMDNTFVINIDGEVTYNSATTNGIVAKSIVPAGSTLNANSSLAKTGIVANNGTLNLSSSDTSVNEVATITGTGTTNISNVILADSITQDTINIPTGARLISGHNGTFKVNNLINDGILSFRGHGREISQANNIISEIHGSVIGADDNGKPIYKEGGRVTFGNGSSAYYISLRDVKISQPMEILNNHTLNVYNISNINGEVTVDSGAVLAAAATGTLNQNVKGAGKLTVATGTLTNNADISTLININSSRTLRTDAGKVHKAINNAGTLILNSGKDSNGDGSSTFSLDGDDAVTGAGVVTVAEGSNVILESALKNTGAKNINANATVTANADLIQNSNVNLNNSGAKLNLTGGNIGVQINGAQNGELHITGNVTDEAKNLGAKVVIDEGGTLRASSNLLANSRDTIDNYGEFYTNGDLSRAITKDGTTYLSDPLTFRGAAEIEGTLNLNNKRLSIEGTSANYNVGVAVGEGDLCLDLDTHTNTATTLTLGAVSNAIFNITQIDTHALYGDYAAGHRNGIIQILKGGSNATLAMDNRIDFSDWDSTEEVVGNVTPNVYYDDAYYARERNFYIDGYVDLASTDSDYDSIEWVITGEREEESDIERKDLLSSWNQKDFNPSSAPKTFSFRTYQDEYLSLNDVGSTTGDDVSVIGVANGNNTVTFSKDSASTYTKPEKSTIQLGNHSGFNIGSSTKFNVSDVTFKNGKDFIIKANGTKFGEIDENHNVSGGIVNTDFIGSNHTQSSSGAVTGGVVNLSGNATVSQIKDVVFKDNILSFTGEDIANSSPEGRMGALYLGNVKVGDTYTDNDGNKVNVGGILNTVIDGTVGTINNANGVTAKTNATSGMVVNGGTISTIKNTIITNNTTTVDNTSIVRGTAISMFGGSIDTMENVEISNNIANAGNQNIYGGAMYLNSPINTIKSSKFVNNRAESTGSSVLGGAFELTGTGAIITLIDDTLFDSNFATTHGGAIYDNGTIKTIKNSTFTNNSTNGEGGAIRVAQGHYIDTITGSNFEGNTAKTYGGAIRLYGTNSTAATLAGLNKLNNTTFKNNSVINTGTTTNDTGWGGAIMAERMYLANGATEAIWTGLNFEGNSVRTNKGVAYGGAVAFATGSGNHDITNSTFKNNYAYSSGNWVHGGALFLTNKTLRKIDNVTFEGNYVNGTSNQRVYGGAIRLASGGVISAITNSTFKGNYASNGAYVYSGAIHLEGGTNVKISKIENCLFDGNYATTSGSYAYGGAIVKDASTVLGSIVNTRFINNYVHGKNVLGGAIWYAGNGSTLNIIADNGLTEFTGNYVENATTGSKSGQAIWLNRPSNQSHPILKLEARGENGHFLLNDGISGTSGYTTNIIGDGVGKFSLFNNISSSNITTDNVNITTVNNELTKEGLATLFNYGMLSLTTDETTKWDIDIDFNEVKADNFKLTNASSGTMYINNLNILNTPTERTKVQVLKTINDDIQLKLNENNINVVTDIVDTLGDTVYDNSNYTQQAGYALSTTDTTNDSILGLVYHKYDNLDLISSSENNEVRNFIFNTTNDYKLSYDMQDSAAGTLNIVGQSDGSVIDANGYDLFKLGNETNLVIKDTTLISHDSDAIYIDNKDATVTLNNAVIDGDIWSTPVATPPVITVDGRGTTEFKGNIAGNGATTVLNRGNLKFTESTFDNNKDTLTLNQGTVTLANNITEDYVINKLTADENTGFSIDIDLENNVADTIRTNTADSAGYVYITDLNYMNGNPDVSDFETQVLFNVSGNDNLQLKLADNLASYKIKDVTKYTDDTVKVVTGFNEKYYTRATDGELWTDIYTTTTETENDTLGVKTNAIWDNASTRIYDDLGDTLVLVNQADYDERTFQSTNAGDRYKLSDDLGTTEGELTLNGVTEGSNISTINLQEHDGFSMADDSTLNVNNVKITGANEETNNVITVDGTGVEVNLNNAYIDGNIKGNEDFDLNIAGQGTTTINGTVSNADVSLNKGTLVINENTFADANTSLTIDDGILDMANGELETYHINNLTSGTKAEYKIDVDLANLTADNIVAEGSGEITLAYFNITGILDEADANAEYRIPILSTHSDNLILKLTETTQSQLDRDYKLGTQHSVVGTDRPNAATLWTDLLYVWEKDDEVWGRLDIDDDKHNSLIFRHLSVVEGDPYRTNLGDTLRIWNQADLGEDNDNKTFSFEDSDNVYSVSENLGTSVGTDLKIIGVAGTDAQNNPQNSTIDMNEKSGFVLDDDTNMTVSDITFTDLNGKEGGLFNVTSEDAILNLNNVNIENESNKNVIVNNGTVNMTGGTVNLQTGISGGGDTNVTGGADVHIADSFSLTQQGVTVTNGSLTMGTNGKINGNLTIEELGNVTVGVNGITTAVGNDGNITFNSSGDLTKNITGDGTTHIDTGAVIVNKATIDQDVDVKDGASLTSHTDNLGGGINNDGDLILKGAIAQEITGTGTTTVNESLNLFNGAGVEGTLDLNDGQISSQDDIISNFNIGKLVDDGTFKIDVDAGQKKSDKYIVGAESSGTININDISFSDLDEVTEDFIAQVTSGSEDVQVHLSDEIKGTDWDLGRTSRNEQDTVKAVTNYDEFYNTYVRGGDLVGNLIEAKTVYEFDSIKMVIDPDKTKWDDTRTKTGSMGDTLYLWNTLDTQVNKSFVYDKALGYTWGDGATGAGQTKGANVTLSGVSASETTKSSIDFSGKTGFELVDATTFNVNDMKLVGGDVITVVNADAKINIKDSYINGNITSDATTTQAAPVYAVEISGTDTTTLRGTFANANTTLTSGNLKLNTDTFADGNDTLAANGGKVVLQNDQIEDYVINELNSTTNAGYKIDINLADRTADTIAVTHGNGKVVLDNLNILYDAENVDNNYIVQILKLADRNDDLQLMLSDTVRAQLDAQPGSPYKIGEREPEYTSDAVQPVTNWKDKYYNYKQVTEILGKLELATKDTTYDSIGIQVSGERQGEKENIGSQGDTLKVVNESGDEPDKTFQFDTEDDVYIVEDNLGKTSGKVTIDGISDGKDSSTIDMNGHSGFEIVDDSEIVINNTEIKNAAAEEGSVINAQDPDAKVTLNNVDLTDNTATGEHGGAIYSNADVTINTNNGSSEISGNKTSNGDEAIYIANPEATLTINTTNDGKITIDDSINGKEGYNVAITGDTTGNVYLNNKINNADATMDNVTLNLSNNDHFESTNFTINSGTLNLVNDKVQDQIAKSFTVNGDFNLFVDVDLNNQKMDRLPKNTVVNNNAFIHVNKINLTSDTEANKVAIPFAWNQFKKNVDYTGPKELSKSTQLTTMFAPIYKYSVEYEIRKDMGYFVFGKGAGVDPHKYGAVNPAIMASPIATQIGGFLNQSQTLQESFYHMNRYTKYGRADRLAAENQNKYAITGTPVYSDKAALPLTSDAMWTRTYSTFEQVGLDNGPKVDNFSYGALYGGDTDLVDLGRGWKGITSAFIGYNGNYSEYDNVSINQQGGTLGVTGTFYKGNFFTGITASAGASAGEASTMYGNDHFASLTAGIANKTGYNIEFKEGRFIIQPAIYLGYTMVNTFDYTNAAGVKINSDPLHAIQIMPGVKFIANTKNGWQPYAGIDMVWNIMDKTDFKANNVTLPQTSVKPYVQYGVGIQRSWGDRFTAFGQAMVRNGGRNGISLAAGFRWALGKDNVKNNDKVQTNDKTVIKQINTKSRNLAKFNNIVNNAE